MKRIEVTMRPATYGAVSSALRSLGVHVMSLSRVESVDRRYSNVRADVAGELQADARSAVKLDLVVADDIAEHVRDAIASSTLGAGRGAGQILISRIDEVVELGANNPKNP